MLGVALEFKNLPDITTPINATNLNDMQKSLVDLIYPIGIYIEISDSDFDPNTVWGGTWVLENDGTVLVSKSNSSSSKLNADVGMIVGKESHSHSLKSAYAKIGTDASSNTLDAIKYVDEYTYNSLAKPQSFSFVSGTTTSATELGGQTDSENNIQPSKITNRWHRTA